MTARRLPRIPPLRPLRCICGRRLGDFRFAAGTSYRIRCPKCSHMNASNFAITSTSVMIFFSTLANMNGGAPDNVGILAAEYLVREKGGLLQNQQGKDSEI